MAEHLDRSINVTKRTRDALRGRADAPRRNGGAVESDHGIVGPCGIGAGPAWDAGVEHRIASFAFQDELTGLGNRRLIGKRLGEMTAAGGGRPFALVVIDLDDFKSVNDAVGHTAGDALLRDIARRMTKSLRPGDVAARVGDDEFAIIVGDVASRTAIEHRVAALRKVLAEPTREKADGPSIGITVGVCLHPEDGIASDDVLRRAELALRRAKAAGRNQTCVFDPAIMDDARRKRETLADLRVALKRGELDVYFQPTIDLRSHIVRAWEALVRWRHPSRGVLTPAAFSAGLEDPVLSVEIDRFVLDTSLRRMRGWLDAGHPVTCVNVNMSEHHLRTDDIVEHVMASLRHYGLEPERLKLELLETAFLGDRAGQVADTLLRFGRLGIVTALDDFGTGYASLTHLKQFKVERIKIDRSFIRDILHDPYDKAITRSIIDLGRNIGMRITAEGVETAEQLSILREFGCDCAQGYLFGRPMPAEDVPGALARWYGGGSRALLGSGPGMAVAAA